MSSTLTLKPPKFVCIDKNVFLGTMKAHPLFETNQIRRVLTLTNDNPYKQSDRYPGVYYKYVQFDEYYKNQIIFAFEECYQYISEAQSYDENIVIESRDMESMSISIGISFLMKKYRISYVEALMKVLPKWTVPPHKAFVHHLNLWQYMGFQFKANDPFFRREVIDWFRFEFEKFVFCDDLTIDQMRYKYVILSVEYKDSRFYIEGRDPTFKCGLSYICIYCGRRLFTESKVIKNDIYFDCKYIYTEPIPWMLGQTYLNAGSQPDLLYGRVSCFKCNKHIGIYDWNPTTGCQCPLHRGLTKYLIYRLFSDKLGVKE